MGVMSSFGNFCKRLTNAVAATVCAGIVVAAGLAALPAGALTFGVGTVLLGFAAAAALEGAKHFAAKAFSPGESKSDYSNSSKFEQEPTFSNADREQPSTPRMGS
jgi:hypothetical protein